MVSAALVLLLVFIPGSSGWRWMHNGLLGLFGVSVLFYGILNLCVAIYSVKIIKNQKQDIIDMDEY